MSIESAIKKYIEATTRSNVFTRYEKEFARKIVSALSEGYHRELFEPKLVQIIDRVVNSVGDLIIRDRTFVYTSIQSFRNFILTPYELTLFILRF